MPSNVTDYGENQYVGALFGATTSVPATYYMALLTAAPSMSDDGTLISEPPGASGYARVAFANTSATWSAPSSGVVVNVAAITFPLATADWPLVTHWALVSASSGGNMYMYSTLQVPRIVQAGHLTKFDPGQLTVSLQGARQPILSAS